MVVSDTGHSGIWTGVVMPIAAAWTQLSCDASAPWAGASPALSARSSPCQTVPCLCFTGDGGFWYHIGELETALRHNVNLVIVVNDNRSLNQEKGPIDRAYDGNATQRAYDDLMMFEDVNLAKVAEAMGCYAERVERPSDIADAMARAFAANKPAVLDMVSDITAMAPQAREEDLQTLP